MFARFPRTLVRRPSPKPLPRRADLPCGLNSRWPRIVFTVKWSDTHYSATEYVRCQEDPWLPPQREAEIARLQAENPGAAVTCWVTYF